ncbi:RTA-like protein [Nemania serpens]|nr:RTA-like protein [Nemania serpens]
MFLTVPRIVAVYGDEYRSWRPLWYLLILSLLTVVSLGLELAGSIVSTAEAVPAVVNAGVTVLVVGLVIQLIALGVFVIHAVLFAIILRIRRHDLDLEFASVYNSNKFTLLLVAFIAATTLIVLRTTYRTVQIAEGFKSFIAQAETLFLILDGAAMLIAAILLLACFPARALGQSWSETTT